MATVSEDLIVMGVDCSLLVQLQYKESMFANIELSLRRLNFSRAGALPV